MKSMKSKWNIDIRGQYSHFFQNIVDDHALPEPAMYVLSLLYAVMIAGSVIGNVLVITAVLKSPSMRKVQEGRERLVQLYAQG